MVQWFLGGAQNIDVAIKVTEAMMVDTSNQPTEPRNILEKL